MSLHDDSQWRTVDGQLPIYRVVLYTNSHIIFGQSDIVQTVLSYNDCCSILGTATFARTVVFHTESHIPFWRRAFRQLSKPIQTNKIFPSAPSSAPPHGPLMRSVESQAPGPPPPHSLFSRSIQRPNLPTALSEPNDNPKLVQISKCILARACAPLKAFSRGGHGNAHGQDRVLLGTRGYCCCHGGIGTWLLPAL